MQRLSRCSCRSAGAPAIALAWPAEIESLFECQLDLVGQFEQAQKIGDRRALLTHLFGERVLRKPTLVDEPLHSQRDFDRVEVLPLDVLHQRHCVQVLVVHLADVGGQRGHVGALCGAPAAFAADDDVLPRRPAASTVMGWMTPSVRIESASSSSASSSNCVRGCVGLGMISETAISAISVIGLSFASRWSLPKMASNPLPNPFCFILSRN